MEGPRAMVAEGLCDILAAVARQRADGVGRLQRLWKLVAETPAEASGLTDRGRIEAGRRADIVLIDWPDGETPAPVATLREGRTVVASGPL